jgi:hypothetical protein
MFQFEIVSGRDGGIDVKITHHSGGTFTGTFYHAERIPTEEWRNFCQMFIGATVTNEDHRSVQMLHIGEYGDVVIDCGDAVVTVVVDPEDTAVGVALEQFYGELEKKIKNIATV